MAATGPNRGEKASLPLHAVPSDSRSVLSPLPRYARREDNVHGDDNDTKRAHCDRVGTGKRQTVASTHREPRVSVRWRRLAHVQVCEALRKGALRSPMHAWDVPLRGDGKSLPDVFYADAICLLRTFAHLRHRYISQASQNLIVLEAC